jgi:hypothetical protein
VHHTTETLALVLPQYSSQCGKKIMGGLDSPQRPVRALRAEGVERTTKGIPPAAKRIASGEATEHA